MHAVKISNNSFQVSESNYVVIYLWPLNLLFQAPEVTTKATLRTLVQVQATCYDKNSDCAAYSNKCVTSPVVRNICPKTCGNC